MKVVEDVRYAIRQFRSNPESRWLPSLLGTFRRAASADPMRALRYE
jgi:hypothetical protein